MEDGVLSPATMFGVQSDSMDFDMDELFLEGCWLETREGSDFTSLTNPLLDPFFFEAAAASNNAQFAAAATAPVNPVQLPGGGAPESTSLWIAPTDGSSPTDVVAKLCRALRYIKDVIRDKSVLVQIWVPVDREGRRVLTTRDLPFAVDDSCQKLARYRDISVRYQFSIDDGDEDDRNHDLVKGLPGRVFSAKVPEWTPDVRFFRKHEYPRLRHAQLYDVRGTLALPVFEHGSRSCLGVVEVVMTTQKIKYRPELESVCKALEAVDLKSSGVATTHNARVYNRYYQAALPEIQEVLRSACETHRLPLAQTWVPCVYQEKGGCRHSEENLAECVSTVDSACFVGDPNVVGFHEACSEHHLFRGQGVVGSAFVTNQPCFSGDVTSYSKTEYPLAHHAVMFGLHAAVAIRLRCIHTGAADFVLEFFLPVHCTDPAEQMKMLSSLSLIIQQCCRTLRVVTDKELAAEEEAGRAPVVLPEEPPRSEAPEAPVVVEEKLMSPEEKDSGLEECSSASAGAGKTGERRFTKAEKTITLQILRQYFAGSLKDAAKSIGVCSTTLKRICRQHGIKRWPSRKIKKVGHSLQKLQLVIDSVQGASGAFQIDSFYSNFPELASPNVSGTSPFSASRPSRDHSRPSNMQPEGSAIGAHPNAATSKSSSSCSQSSSSSQCCSSQRHRAAATATTTTTTMWNVTSSGEKSVLKRVRSEAELDNKSEAAKTAMPRSQSHKSLVEHRRARKQLGASALKTEGEFQRVKVTFGDEKTRFRMERRWGFAELQGEIARRFGVEDMAVFSIKYLDDDEEWVLLTCDADLEECFEVSRASQSGTIKLSLQVSNRVSRGYLGPQGLS